MTTHCQYFDVFGERANRDLYNLALTKRDHFTHSKTSPSRHYPDWRKSKVVYDAQVSEVTSGLERYIRARLPEVLPTLGIPRFEIDRFEIQLTSHNDGEYFKWHTDNSTRETATRTVTFVYYFHDEPKRFTGGDLVIYRPDGVEIVIEPKNDSIVFFGSGTRHEVRSVVCPSRRFEDSRFTLNGWVRRKVPMRLDDEFFGLRIFSPQSRTRQQWSRGPRVATAGGANRPVGTAPPGRHAAGKRAAQGDAATASMREAPARMAALLNVYGDLYRHSRRAGVVETVSAISGPDFFENFYYANRPVLVRGLFAASAAVQRWSPEFFGRKFGSVPVQITTGRSRDPAYEVRFRETTQMTTMAEFTERLSREPESNDFYLVARNHFFENPAFRSLRDELQPPPDIIDTGDRSPGVVKLWFGPKGTVTPLHFDEHSILFAQIYGRKRFKLIPSFDYARMYVRDRYYSAVDPERPDLDRYADFGKVTTSDVVVEAGDALFLPVAWWHWAKSLDTSISVTLSSFRVPGGNTSVRFR